MVRREAFLEVGGFNAAYRAAEDAELAWRLRDRGYRISLVDKPLISFAFPDKPAVYVRKQVRNAGYHAALGLRKRGSGMAMGYSGWGEYMQSLWPSLLAAGMVLGRTLSPVVLWSAFMILVLLAVNQGFLRFAFHQGQEQGRLRLLKLVAFLVLRSLAWNLGLAYGMYLAVRGSRGVVGEVPYSEG
jgi:cellulose synthase/poly-beta-1,6-N-acetylglucosamine synthase-like glycosyltransferase